MTAVKTEGAQSHNDPGLTFPYPIDNMNFRTAVGSCPLHMDGHLLCNPLQLQQLPFLKFRTEFWVTYKCIISTATGKTLFNSILRIGKCHGITQLQD